MDESEEQNTERRSTRRRATRDSIREASRERASRRVAKPASKPVKKTVAAPSSSPSPKAESRKAPTSIASSKARKLRQQKQRIVIGVILVLGIVSSALVGFTDSGQIDVNQTIEERNNRIRNNQASEGDTLISNVEIPVQNTNNDKPDGGLRGLGITETKPKTPPVVATTTATSSDAVATSTEAVASSTEEVIEDGEEESTDTVSEPEA